jgi:hypothetical protein
VWVERDGLSEVSILPLRTARTEEGQVSFVRFVRFVRCVKFSCVACWDARKGHASPHIPPDDAAPSGLPETVVEPGDGGWVA